MSKTTKHNILKIANYFGVRVQFNKNLPHKSRGIFSSEKNLIRISLAQTSRDMVDTFCHELGHLHQYTVRTTLTRARKDLRRRRDRDWVANVCLPFEHEADYFGKHFKEVYFSKYRSKYVPGYRDRKKNIEFLCRYHGISEV